MATVLITGTSKGIGLAAALEFGRAGYTVYATMRNPARAPELAERASAAGIAVKVLAMDVDSDESVAAAMTEIEKDAEQIDVLINNAGIEFRGSVEEQPIERFRAVMETNYFGVLRCLKAVLPQMRERGSGCILNVSSVSGQIAVAPLVSYGASKFALEALSECLAQEMKTFGVRVAIVEPGIIDTAMARDIGTVANDNSHYRQQRRLSALFAASLDNAPAAELVAAKMLEIVKSGTWKLRHPVGPDAEPFLGWRKSMTDEQWVALNAAGDDDWYARLEADFGMKIRPQN